jgi:hypothetical protein
LSLFTPLVLNRLEPAGLRLAVERILGGARR